MLTFTITKEELALLEDILQKYRLQDENFEKEYAERMAFTARVVLAVNVEKVCGACGK